MTNGALTDGIMWVLYNFHYWDYGIGLVKKADSKKVDLSKNPNKGAEELIKFFWKSRNKKKGTIAKRPIYTDILKKLKNINHKKYKCYNEAAVKQYLILPMLCSLEWNLRDPDEFVFNPLIKYKKERYKPDFLLNNYKSPAVAIEVKRMGYNLLNGFNAVKDFTLNGKADVGVLSDGKNWIFILSKEKKFWGFYEHNIDSSNISETSKLLKILLSKESVNKTGNIEYLEHIV